MDVITRNADGIKMNDERIKRTIYLITNNTSRDVFLIPYDDRLIDWSFIIRSNSDLIIDLEYEYIDFNECYFQFKDKKRKIKFKNISKHGIEVHKCTG